MRRLSENSRPLNTLRFASALILSLPLYAYLDEILSLWFIAAVLITAVSAGMLTEKTGLRFMPAFAVIALSAVLIRVIVLIGSSIITAAADSAALDFSLFSFDSGFFPLLPLYLYVAICWFLVKRKPRFIIVEILINAVIYCLLLWSQGGYNMTVFPHPGLLAVFGIVFFIIELVILLLTAQVGSHRTRLGFAIFIIPLFLAAVFIFFGRYSEGASKDGGGLMQPTLFRFDFSDYVKLESEISMDNDLVLLFRNYGYLNSVYLRRFYLSGYKSGQGFFLQGGPGETEQPLTLPDTETELEVLHYPKRIESEQEYFIVNFDPSSLIAMNYPVKISPLTNWTDSSFLRNYRVISESVEQPSWELSEAPLLEMDEDLFNYYTECGNDQLIKDLAEEITAGIGNPYDQVIAIMFYLHDSYFYSLKPGVSADGNQLHHFLFDAKKGYCSYFAFSMALMCRSIGIPARVAAGFFIDPQSGILNVYPVREDMAHAWVEVPFEDFGWVEFDPTTDRLAPGEEIEFAALDSAEYSNLVEEILRNDYSVELEDELLTDSRQERSFSSVVKRLGGLLKMNAGWFLTLIYILAVLIFHLREAKAVRSKQRSRRTRAVYRRALRLYKAFGWRRGRRESVLEYARRLSSGPFPAFLPLSESYLELIFAAGVNSQSIEKAEAAEYNFNREYRAQPFRKRLIILLFPFVKFRPPSGAALSAMFLLILFLSTPPAYSENLGSPGDYIDMAALEKDAENYEAALGLLNEGIALFPDDYELKLAAGDLYADRELYNLALEQYRLALSLSSDNPEILYQKSVVEGLLNLDEQSILTLENILEFDPENYDVLADLGWMYFKTFRLADAEALLLEAIEIYDDSPILYMTLGTVYSGMYEYENAEHYYLESIRMALDKGWNYFASVSYYNLSLLEHGFYNYEKALEYTNKSIEYGERAPGYISRAEIYVGRLNFEKAFMNYQQAYTTDSTPLALMGQAELYLSFGLLDEALSHINEVLKHDDESWMYYFGVDPDRHRMETDRILMDVYQAMSTRERYRPSAGIQRVKTLYRRLRYSALGWYHERRYRQASFDVGQSNEQQGNVLDAAWAYFVANEDYRPQAERYLHRAETIEMKTAPEAEGFYLLERGRLLSDAQALGRAVQILDPEWEKLQVSEALIELIMLEKDDKAPSAVRLTEELYELNPGVFITKGIAFPLSLGFKPGFFLRRSLRQSGFNFLINNNDYSYRYMLSTADTQSEGVLYSVLDNESGSVLFEIFVEDKLNTPKKVSAFTAELKKRLFSIADGKDVHF